MAYSAEQLGNAHTIMAVASQRAAGLGVSVTDLQVLCVMTALTESTLVNVNHGDGPGPSSRGLFQQMPSWGTEAQRMNPAQSTGLFIDAVARVPGYRLLIRASKPSLAQSVQQSQFSNGSNYLAQLGNATALVSSGAAGGITTADTYTIAGITLNDPVWRKYLNSDGTYKGFPPANGRTADERARQLPAMQAAKIPGIRQLDGTYVSVNPAGGDLSSGYSTATHYSQAATNADVKGNHLSTITFDGAHKIDAYINETWNVTSGDPSGDATGGVAPGLGPLNTLFGTGWEYYLWVAAGGILLLAGVVILAKNSLPQGTAGTIAKVAAL